MSSGDDNDLDHTLAGLMSNELVATTESPQQSGCLKNLLGVVPTPPNNAGSTVHEAAIPRRQHKGTAERMPLPGPFFAYMTFARLMHY